MIAMRVGESGKHQRSVPYCTLKFDPSNHQVVIAPYRALITSTAYAALLRTWALLSAWAARCKAGTALLEPINPKARAAASRTFGLESPANVAVSGSTARSDRQRPSCVTALIRL